VNQTTEIPFTQFLGVDGSIVRELPIFADEQKAIMGLYRAMVRTQIFDLRAVELQRTGQLGTYASSLGQEAVAVGIGAAMTATDVLLPSFREHGTLLMRGVTMLELLRFWSGDERGSNYARPREDFPVSVPIGSHAPHASGVAFAIKLRGEHRAALCVLGDGATSKGDFYEAINMAGVWNLPAVFVVTNNQWAISLPRARQTAAETIAQKAVAAGFEGRQVDGNDVIAVTHEVREALEKARSGGGPTLIEAITYRLADHTTADDASRYRDENEVTEHWQQEPLVRLRRYLTEREDLSREQDEALKTACSNEVEQAVSEFLADIPQPVSAMFDYLYGELPTDLIAQRMAAIAEAEPDG
jgi:pyruvate dehydrogenase E1 component alpha subunit